LTPIVVNTLREWKFACPKSEAGLVFPSSGGLVEHHKNIVERGLVPTLIAGDVTIEEEGPDGNQVKRAKYTGLHALRHFYASWCINRRVDGGLELPAKVVQERLGHSSIMMTMDVYGHLFPRGDDSAELEAAERSLLA
jgi:integrase